MNLRQKLMAERLQSLRHCMTCNSWPTHGKTRFSLGLHALSVSSITWPISDFANVHGSCCSLPSAIAEDSTWVRENMSSVQNGMMCNAHPTHHPFLKRRREGWVWYLPDCTTQRHFPATTMMAPCFSWDHLGWL